MTALIPIRVDFLACDEIPALVSELIDGDLEARQATRVELHLATCPACARFARELAATVAALHAMRFRWPGIRSG